MLIQVTGGTGAGPTKMAAFDAALNQAGTANYNLIKLSSIIPPDSKVKAAGWLNPASKIVKS
jgi:arginine decarboxylase